jgi:hypothetical protein
MHELASFEFEGKVRSSRIEHVSQLSELPINDRSDAADAADVCFSFLPPILPELSRCLRRPSVSIFVLNIVEFRSTVVWLRV